MEKEEIKMILDNQIEIMKVLKYMNINDVDIKDDLETNIYNTGVILENNGYNRD